jgi:hypothetical protein
VCFCAARERRCARYTHSRRDFLAPQAGLEQLRRRLARTEQTAQVRVCRDLLRRLKAHAGRQGARRRAGAARRPSRRAASRAARLRDADSRKARRRGGWSRALFKRRQAREARRSSPARCLLWQATAPSPEPQGQPSAQLRLASARRHPGARACPGESVPFAKAGGGQEPPRGASLSQATPGPSRVQDPAADRPPPP